MSTRSMQLAGQYVYPFIITSVRGKAHSLLTIVNPQFLQEKHVNFSKGPSKYHTFLSLLHLILVSPSM
jgi:hypothetical protein